MSDFIRPQYSRATALRQSPRSPGICIRQLRQLAREYHAGRLNLDQYHARRRAAKAEWRAGR